MPILAFIASLFSPAVSILQNLHTSDEDKMKLQNELAKIQAGVQDKMIELQEAQFKLEEAEAQSKYWLTANWRPLCSVVIVAVIVFASFGLCHPDASFYDLAKYFLVGYTGARTVDKTVSAIPAIVKKIKG